MKIGSFYFTFALNYYLLGIIFRYILLESNQIFSIRLLFCSTMHEVMRQARGKVWKSGGARSTVVGIICPPGWDRVNCLAKNWGAKAPPPAPRLRRPCEVLYSCSCCIPDCSVIQQSDLLYGRTLRYYLSKLISLWGASKSSYVVYNFTHTIQGDFFCVSQTYGARKGCHLLWVGKHNKMIWQKIKLAA